MFYVNVFRFCVMLILSFKNREDELFDKALRKALNFNGYKKVDDRNYVKLTFDEIIDNWNWFHTMFQIVMEFDTTKILFHNKIYKSKEDLDSFYQAAKLMYYEWLSFTNSHIINIYRDIPEKHKITSMDPELLDDKELDELIDLMLNNKEARADYSKRNNFSIVS